MRIKRKVFLTKELRQIWRSSFVVPSFTVGEKQKRSKYAENTGKKSVHFIQKKYIYQRMMAPIVPKVGISERDKALMMDEKSSLD